KQPSLSSRILELFSFRVILAEHFSSYSSAISGRRWGVTASRRASGSSSAAVPCLRPTNDQDRNARHGERLSVLWFLIGEILSNRSL
uniref:Uncharacterized protein n=1 Tax=Triticum urartu TaxID=4572 RepID=A0A8R7QUE4_TRIUA